MADRKLVLLNDLALQVKPETVKPGDAARIFVAGNNLVRMTLAELALPGAEMVWTDFRHSASLGALQAAVQAAGGLDRLVLAVDGEHGEAAFSIMCAVLTLLPPLRRRQTSEIELICLPGKAAASLMQFVDRIRPQLASRGVGVSLEMLAEPVDRSLA
ncbi:hypothetical protein [Tabrizicola sp.]|uniref:hypothetical protein n=1 Tax=Tabrizicola sp. TaxID=2005166 RepID=UPI001A44BB18|nr:hypothetical protein [Tabrizicola sp.]MBL9072763.1 hypothetical protein [Tabrizicola sp.]